ncbi:MAG: 3-isopropylmalate dehydrogenase [Spirochaetes bacterium GWC1_27_15]|nr:MAG: 3-isopropylmalate dehydrogenase [Spirochaetes bacterium GWB1_27_13]OHD26568.1 MAG: 3-isopropylmalate dehydrogenase [Spirochaetes bacterium GWC1_27_15]
MYKIAVIGGDGTGPEVVNEGKKVLEASCKKNGVKIEFTNFDFGGERYLKTGETITESAIEDLKNFDAIYLGAIGHPDVKPGILEQGILLKLRFTLDQYINLRPVKLFENVECPIVDKKPEDVDFVVIRENTGGIYTGHGGVTKKGTQDEIASQLMIYDRKTVDRCLKYAFELKQKRNKLSQKYAEKPIHLVHKRNVLTHCGDLWFRAYEEMGNAQYKDMKRDYQHVDAATMWFVKNPEWFDVIVTENLFGDIITDLGAMIQGGMGVSAGGNINPNGLSMFEPIGGSAPKYKGQNIINPIAAILAGSMMMEVLGETKIAEEIEKSVRDVVKQMKSMSAGKMGMSTTDVGDKVAKLCS